MFTVFDFVLFLAISNCWQRILRSSSSGLLKTFSPIALGAHSPQQARGGRGRIRTSVARKERQIYSLLVLTTHPPVPIQTIGTQNSRPEKNLQDAISTSPETPTGALPRCPTKRPLIPNAKPDLRPKRPRSIDAFKKLPMLHRAGHTRIRAGLASKDTSPFGFRSRICSASFPHNLLAELAEGIEPPTL